MNVQKIILNNQEKLRAFPPQVWAQHISGRWATLFLLAPRFLPLKLSILLPSVLKRLVYHLLYYLLHLVSPQHPHLVLTQASKRGDAKCISEYKQIVYFK